MIIRCAGNTALIDSSGMIISQHVVSHTEASLSLMGAKYHPQREKVVPTLYVAAASGIHAERLPMGVRNKAN